MLVCVCVCVPDSSEVAVIVDYVKVRDSAIALLLAWFVLKLLQSHTLRKCVDTQDLSRLCRETQDALHV